MNKIRTIWRRLRGARNERPHPLKPKLDLEELELDKEHDARLRRIAEARQQRIDEALRSLDRELDVRYGYIDDKRSSH